MEEIEIVVIEEKKLIREYGFIHWVVVLAAKLFVAFLLLCLLFSMITIKISISK